MSCGACRRPPPPPQPSPVVTHAATPDSVYAARCADAADAGSNAALAAGPVDVGDAGTGAAVPNAERVIAALRPQLRVCYTRGLQKERTMEGRVLVVTRIAATGAVDAACIREITGLSEEVAGCLVRTVKQAKFDRPDVAGARLSIPISFLQQK